MKTFIVAIIILFSQCASAQWTKITHGFFEGVDEEVTCIYFLDLPGPPRIGFAGDSYGILKTTDGGVNWQYMWDSCRNYGNIMDIFLKDSLTGWFTIANGGGTLGRACYRTNDGGAHWNELSVPNAIVGSDDIYYNSGSKLLILSSSVDTGIRISTDFGNSWTILPTSQAAGISFFSDSKGIAAAFHSNGDTNHGIIRTTDGGYSWNTVEVPASCVQPLAIPETSICFEADYGNIIVRRSDDFGQTWRVLKDFGPFMDPKTYQQIAPSGNGFIRGDLSRLTIQTDDSGMLISTDQGVTWEVDGGPSYGNWISKFYSANGITIADMVNDSDAALYGGGLWEEIWPQSGVSEPEPSSDSLTVYPNPATGTVTISGAAKEATIYDPLGRERFLSRSENTIDISSLTSGMYYLRIQTANNETRTLKLLKQ